MWVLEASANLNTGSTRRANHVINHATRSSCRESAKTKNTRPDRVKCDADDSSSRCQVPEV